MDTKRDTRKRDRIALTPPPELRAALEEVAEALGKSVSAVAVELLAEMVPQMQGIAKIARATKAGNKAAAKRALVHMVGDSLAEAMAAQQSDLYGRKR